MKLNKAVVSKTERSSVPGASATDFESKRSKDAIQAEEASVRGETPKDSLESSSSHRLRDIKDVEADAKNLGDAFVKQLRSNMVGWEPATKKEWFTKEQLEGLKKMRDSI